MKYFHDALFVLPRENEGNMPDLEGKARVELAIKLFKERKAPLLLMQGLHSSNPSLIDRKITLARAMQDYAISLGLDAKCMEKEELSVDTVGHAILGGNNFVIPRGFKSIGIVTSNYHIARVEPIFRRVFGQRIDLGFYGCDFRGSREEEKRKLGAFERTFQGIKQGDLEGFLQRLYEKHTLYQNFKQRIK